MMFDHLFLLKINECDVCVNWNMMENSDLMKYESPEHYLSTTYLTPKKLTFADYKDKIKVCHDKLVSKEWSENNVRVYCAVNCISKHGQDKIIRHADNCLALQSSFVLSEKKNIILQEKYKKCVGGPYFNGPLEIYQFLDCIIHLLFLGVVGTTRNLIIEWISSNKNKATYIVIKNTCTEPYNY